MGFRALCGPGRAPMDGVVSAIHKEIGEYVAPTDPHIMNIVQLDRLQAVFSVPSEDATTLRTGDSVAIRLSATNVSVTGVVEFVAPVTDAESGTVRVKVRMENPQSTYRSGQRCSLRLTGNTTTPGSQITSDALSRR